MKHLRLLPQLEMTGTVCKRQKQIVMQCQHNTIVLLWQFTTAIMKA